MTFQEIFEEEGLYVADSFREGFCFLIIKNQVTHNLELKGVSYENANSISRDEYIQPVYAELFDKDYRKVLTRQSLFKK